MKSILGIITFILTFGLSVSLVGLVFGFPESNASQTHQFCNNSAAKYKIRSLIKRDVRNGHWRNHKVKSIEGYYTMTDADLYANDIYRQAINDYVAKSSSISDSDLPDDFKYAWREHMEAWQNQASLLNSLDWESNVSPSNFSNNTKEINETWYQVLRIAERYGVEIIPAYYQ